MADLMITDSTGLDRLRPDIIQQTEAYGDVSNQYIATSSQEIITEMNKYQKFNIAGFNNANVRKIEKDGYQKHVIKLEAENANMIDGTKMQIILFNSNDRSSSIRMMLGVFRAVCDNGMILSDDFIQETRIRHTKKDWQSSIKTLMDDYADAQAKTEDMIQRMMKRQMTYAAMSELSERVSEELWKGTGQIIDPYAFNASKRIADNGKDLWHTYQRVQANLLGGGLMREITKTTDDGVSVVSQSKTHAITDEKEKIRLNKELHKMCMEVL